MGYWLALEVICVSGILGGIVYAISSRTPPIACWTLCWAGFTAKG
jgi:hypothetical protein